MKLQTLAKLLSNLELVPCTALMLLAIAVSCKSFTTAIFLKYRCTVRCPDIIKAPGDVSVRHFFLTSFTPSFQANLNTLRRARICHGKILTWVGRELLPLLSPCGTSLVTSWGTSLPRITPSLTHSCLRIHVRLCI